MIKKIGIITLNPSLPVNIGNVLQAFALQKKIKEILPDTECKIVNQKTTKCSNFYLNNCLFTNTDIDDTYDCIVAGSDQIWANGLDINKYYLLNYPNKIRKIFYAASFGNHSHKWDIKNTKKINNSLKNNKFISVRELTGIFLCKKWFDIEAKSVLDPTMLYDKEFYNKTINENECTKPSGIFAYILDSSQKWKETLKQLSKQINQPILSFDWTVENFIHNFNNASCIITDSYHGSVFSLIFNKPFICLRNIKRGNDRFDDLCLRFENLENRFIYDLDINKMDLLSISPNVNNKILEYRKDSLNFLISALN